jgi:hypothetical protein
VWGSGLPTRIFRDFMTDRRTRRWDLHRRRSRRRSSADGLIRRCRRRVRVARQAAQRGVGSWRATARAPPSQRARPGPTRPATGEGLFARIRTENGRSSRSTCRRPTPTSAAGPRPCAGGASSARSSPPWC